MAFPSTLVFSLLLVATVPLAHGLTIDGVNITKVEVSGQVFCTATGNAEPGSNSAGAAGASVSLACGDRTNLAQATTNATGFFDITLSGSVLDTVNDVSNCTAVVSLPIANCTATPLTGSLQASVTLLDVISPILGVVGVVARCVIQKLHTVVQ